MLLLACTHPGGGTHDELSYVLHNSSETAGTQGTASRWSDASLLVFTSATPAGGQGMLL
jgi:hypothetical protein